ncbi:MAG: 6-phospho-beta-glucosidase [Blastocatellia bacterium]
MSGNKKLTLIGGGGVRTPLLVHGLAEAASALGIDELALYDIDLPRAELMAALGREIASKLCPDLRIVTPEHIEEAVAGADYVLHSIRVGGIAARARDERIAIEHGVAGQETTGLGGLAKALRTVPVAIRHAQIVQRHAPDAWFISFTNPAGLMTQALAAQTKLKLIGICDTPSEMFHRLAAALGEPLANIECDYFGLNHLGWVRAVRANGQDATARALHDDAALRSLYHADLFDPAMIRALGMIPGEYLFFYYCQQRALANQRRAGASRGEEIENLNARLFDQLGAAINAGHADDALTIYRQYLQRRSGSYMKLEAEAGSAHQEDTLQQEDPFTAATGYHRIALDVIDALNSDTATRIVVNVLNRGAITDLRDDDAVEVPCLIDRTGARPLPVGPLPDAVRGLVQSVKEYERLAIRAALAGSATLAQQALLACPIVGEWEPAQRMIRALMDAGLELTPQPDLLGAANL